MKTYRCWRAEDMDEADAVKVEAESWKDAAKQFAEKDFYEESYDEITVHVRTKGGTLYEISAEAEQVLEVYMGLGRKIESAPRRESAVQEDQQ